MYLALDIKINLLLMPHFVSHDGNPNRRTSL